MKFGNFIKQINKFAPNTHIPAIAGHMPNISGYLVLTKQYVIKVYNLIDAI